MSGIRQDGRGRPLGTFAILLGAWVLMRFATWEPLLAPIGDLARQSEALLATGQDAAGPPHLGERPSGNGSEDFDVRAASEGPSIGFAQSTPSTMPGAKVEPAFERELLPGSPASDPSAVAGHQLLWAAAMAHLPSPHLLVERQVSPTRLAPTDTETAKQGDRWSLDAWAFWRADSPTTPAAEGRAPLYGANQAAAVLRYRIAPGDPRDPRGYIRAYKALVSGGESEVAAGLSARPFETLPLRVHGEVRVTRFDSGTAIRPAAFVTTELAPAVLAAGFKAEVYGQAGYVGGESQTAFVDGQLHLLRGLADFDLGAREKAKVSLGGGAWGGAQEHSNRLDLGPSMRLDLSIGETPARLSVDWRERVAGNAEPESGVAVTLSTRF